MPELIERATAENASKAGTVRVRASVRILRQPVRGDIVVACADKRI